jgi:hypothetical protein
MVKGASVDFMLGQKKLKSWGGGSAASASECPKIYRLCVKVLHKKRMHKLLSKYYKLPHSIQGMRICIQAIKTNAQPVSAHCKTLKKSKPGIRGRSLRYQRDKHSRSRPNAAT